LKLFDLNINFKDFKNVSSLGLIQLSNAIMPIMAMPLVYGAIGHEDFSILVTSESIVFFILTFCIYSYDISGVTKIIAAETSDGVKSVINEVLWSRSLLFLLCLASVAIFGSLILEEKLVNLILIWMLVPFGYILQTNFYYQAIQNNAIISILIFTSRVISLTILLYYLYEIEGNNVEFIAFIISSSFALSGFLSFIYIKHKTRLKLTRTKTTDLIKGYKEGLPILVSNLSVGLFRGSNIIILSLTSSSTDVSIYALAEKFIKALQSTTRPLVDWAFPRLTYKNDIKKLYIEIKKYYKFILFLIIPILLVTNLIMYAMLISELIQVITFKMYLLVSIMMPCVAFGIYNYIFGLIGLNISGHSKGFLYDVTMTGLFSIFIIIVLASTFDSIGASFGYVFGEILLSYFVYTRYKRLR